MKISVVIPTYNRRASLAVTLPSVLAQEFPADQYEVVLVVDGSGDGTVEYLRSLRPSCRLRILEQTNHGPARARNSGVENACGELVLFLDDDIVCTPNLLTEHAAAHASCGPAVVHGQIGLSPESSPSLFAAMTASWYKQYYSRLNAGTALRLPADVFLIANSSMPRSVFLKTGGFDPQVAFPREDFEFGFRLWKGGVRFQYQPRALAHELFTKASLDWARNDAVGHGRAEVAIARKHPEYRPYSALKSVAGHKWLKGRLWKFAVVSRFAPRFLLDVCAWIGEQLQYVSAARSLGTWALGVRHRIGMLRGAAQAVGSWQALNREFGVSLPCLMYHHVGLPRAGTYEVLTISPPQFERQMRWLADHGYVGIRACDWLQWYKHCKNLPERPILLTFDDAYADICKYAMPVLQQHGFGATVFVPTDAIGADNAWDQVDGIASLPVMSVADIQEWAKRGIEFGNHSRYHSDLTKLAADELIEEVKSSACTLESITGALPLAFAYPYGYYDDRVKNSVRGSCEMAFSIAEGLNSLQTDPFELRRTLVRPADSLVEFASRVYVGKNLVPYRQLKPLNAAVSRLLGLHAVVRLLRTRGIGGTSG